MCGAYDSSGTKNFRTLDDAAGNALIESVMTLATKNIHTLGDAAGSAVFRSVMALAAKKFHSPDVRLAAL